MTSPQTGRTSLNRSSESAEITYLASANADRNTINFTKPMTKKDF